jgi:DNA polymerase family B
MCSCTPQVNRRYSKLQIALDGVYKVILLLKKKKYAAIKFETGPDGLEREVRAVYSCCLHVAPPLMPDWQCGRCCIH